VALEHKKWRQVESPKTLKIKDWNELQVLGFNFAAYNQNYHS
jgi:hypothetical protein